MMLGFPRRILRLLAVNAATARVYSCWKPCIPAVCFYCCYGRPAVPACANRSVLFAVCTCGGVFFFAGPRRRFPVAIPLSAAAVVLNLPEVHVAADRRGRGWRRGGQSPQRPLMEGAAVRHGCVADSWPVVLLRLRCPIAVVVELLRLPCLTTAVVVVLLRYHTGVVGVVVDEVCDWYRGRNTDGHPRDWSGSVRDMRRPNDSIGGERVTPSGDRSFSLMSRRHSNNMYTSPSLW